MHLTYRGGKYDYTPANVDMQESEETGKFRGVDIRFRSVKKAPVQQPNLDLVYRGVAYRSAANGATDNPERVFAPGSSAVTTDNRARMMLMNRHRLVKRRQQSMLSRLAGEVGLPADAARYWNHIQGKIHPSFWSTYDRSSASIS